MILGLVEGGVDDGLFFRTDGFRQRPLGSWGHGALLQRVDLWRILAYGGFPAGPCCGWDGGRLPRAGRVGGASRCGSLTVREVSFGGAWPGSRIRYDEGGHAHRFRLGCLGRVQSRRDDDGGDCPFGDVRQDAGPGFCPVDVALVRCEGDLNDRVPVVPAEIMRSASKRSAYPSWLTNPFWMAQSMALFSRGSVRPS